MMQTIDCTPTWAGVIDIYITALERRSGAGAEAARDEIRRLARQYGGALDYIREMDAAIKEFLAAWDMEQDTPEHNQRDRLEAAIEALRELFREAGA